jgi:hypothetical protein
MLWNKRIPNQLSLITNCLDSNTPFQMLVSPPEFQYFLVQFGSKYPYSEVSNTRRRFYVKWLITNKATRGFLWASIPCNTESYTAIPSNAIDDELVQYLIDHKKAQPATAVMATILDWMHCCGRGQDVHWYAHVVDWLHFLLYHGIQFSDGLVLRDCVEFRIRKLIVMNGQDMNTIIGFFHQFFDNQYQNGVSHFYDLAVQSIQWLKNWIPTQLLWPMPIQLRQTVVMSSP